MILTCGQQLDTSMLGCTWYFLPVLTLESVNNNLHWITTYGRIRDIFVKYVDHKRIVIAKVILAKKRRDFYCVDK